MRLLFLLIYCLSFNFLVLAHEDQHATRKTHHENIQSQFGDVKEAGDSKSWIQWIGSFHLVFLHFPIALINMLAISEVLLICYRQQIFEFSSRFLFISAAILTPPTALLGFIYSYSVSYSGLMKTYLIWHMWFGISTAMFSLITLVLFPGIFFRVRDRTTLCDWLYHLECSISCLVALGLLPAVGQ